MTLGGYDSAKFQPNEVEFDFAMDPTRQLVTQLQGVTYSDGKEEKKMLKEGILALVDSTVPYIWLPQSACEAFEDAFGISWDPIRNLYLVKDDTHEDLVKTNPSLTFSLATGGQSVNITFPYAAFDLNASYPVVKNESRYFPLQRAPNDRSYTLGRTFLQEAYIITNYETSTFSLSQALFDGAPSHIVPITSNVNGSSEAGATGGATKSKGKSGGLATGAIAGIVVAVIILAIIAAVGAFLWRRRRKQQEKDRAAEFHKAATAYPPDIKLPEGSTARTSTDDSRLEKSHMESTVHSGDRPMTPVNEVEGDPGPSQPHELPANRLSRGDFPPGELSSTTDLLPATELPSPGLHGILLRSELSTPDPTSQELPTPDPSAELPSPPLLPKQRPQSQRMDSSGSESSFGRDVLGIGHRRAQSDNSRPGSSRNDAEGLTDSPTDVESPVLPIDSPVVAQDRSVQQLAKRPGYARQDSDTITTRLSTAHVTNEESEPPSRFGTIKENTRKGSETSEVGSVSSLGDSPVVRKPVPFGRQSVDAARSTLHEEDEDKAEKAKE